MLNIGFVFTSILTKLGDNLNKSFVVLKIASSIYAVNWNESKLRECYKNLKEILRIEMQKSDT